MNRFPELDGFRGFLAVAVMMIHAGIAPLYWMNAGMDCFFAMSAFVITLGLLNAKARTRIELLTGFLLRRTARIFPMYYALLAATALLLLVINAMPSTMALKHYPLSSLQPYLFYLQYTELYGSSNEAGIWFGQLRFIPHTWSLAVEEQFYLLWGLLFVLASARWMKLAIALSFIGIGVWARTSGMVMSPLIVYRLDAFGYGILLALLYHGAECSKDWCRLRSYLRICVPVFLISLLLFLIVTDVPGTLADWYRGSAGALGWEWSPISAITSCGTAALIGMLAFGSGSAVFAVLRTRPMRYLGWISYAIYLIHYPVVDVLLNLNHPLLGPRSNVNIAVAVLLVLGLSHLATRVFDRLNRRLIARLGPSPKATLPPHPLPTEPLSDSLPAKG